MYILSLKQVYIFTTAWNSCQHIWLQQKLSRNRPLFHFGLDESPKSSSWLKSFWHFLGNYLVLFGVKRKTKQISSERYSAPQYWYMNGRKRNWKINRPAFLWSKWWNIDNHCVFYCWFQINDMLESVFWYIINICSVFPQQSKIYFHFTHKFKKINCIDA